MAEAEEPDLFASSGESESEAEAEVPLLELAPGEKGLPLGHRGKNYVVQEGKRRGTKVYVSGSFGYTFEGQNAKKISSRANHPVIHLKCQYWPVKYGKCPSRAKIDERDRLLLRHGSAFDHNHDEQETKLKLESRQHQVNIYVDIFNCLFTNLFYLFLHKFICYFSVFSW